MTGCQESGRCGVRFHALLKAYISIKRHNGFAFGFLHWGAKTGLAASPPVFAWYYGTIQTVGVVLIATAAIAGLHSVVGLLDALSKEKSSSTSDNQSDVIVRFGDLLAAHRQKGNLAVDAKDDAIRACLGILEIFTRQTTKSKKATFRFPLFCIRKQQVKSEYSSQKSGK